MKPLKTLLPILTLSLFLLSCSKENMETESDVTLDYELFRGNSTALGKVMQINKQDEVYEVYGEFNYVPNSDVYIPKNIKLLKSTSKNSNVEKVMRLDEFLRPTEYYETETDVEPELIYQFEYYKDSTIFTKNTILENGFFQNVSREKLSAAPQIDANAISRISAKNTFNDCDDPLEDMKNSENSLNICDDKNLFLDFRDWLNTFPGKTGIPARLLADLIDVAKDASCKKDEFDIEKSNMDPLTCEEYADPVELDESLLPKVFVLKCFNRSNSQFLACSTNPCNLQGTSYTFIVNGYETELVPPGGFATIVLPYEPFTWTTNAGLLGGPQTIVPTPPNDYSIGVAQCCDVNAKQVTIIGEVSAN